MKERFWELQGTAMGKAVGLKGGEEEKNDGIQDDEYDHKKDNQYKEAFGNQNKQSEFAKTKTIAEQRRTLPGLHSETRSAEFIERAPSNYCSGWDRVW